MFSFSVGDWLSSSWRQRFRKPSFSAFRPSTLIRKASVFESLHLGRRFRKRPFSWVEVSVLHLISVDDRRKRIQKYVFSSENGLVWTGLDASRHQGNSNKNQRTLEGDPRMPKKVADNMFQIQNILARVLQCFVIDWNRFRERSRQANTVIQALNDTIGNGDKRKRTNICFSCVLDDMFSGFNTARKAAWLYLMQLECASDR